MSLATYKDLCLDAADPVQLGAFWGAVLDLEPRPAGEDSQGDVTLRGATDRHTVWVNGVPEPRTVKHRMHLDVNVASVEELIALGATVLDADSFSWTVMADPEGGEFCAFVREGEITRRLYEIGVDSDGSLDERRRLAEWWAEATSGRAGVEGEVAYVDQIPGAPFESLVFVQVPEPRMAKNRVHLDLSTPSVDALVLAGATVLRRRDDEISWTVLADPDGNELCAFED